MKFRNDTEIMEAFEEAFDATGEATPEKVDAAVKAVAEAASKEFGPQGLYVTGTLNPDMQCVSFQFKRPGVSQRVQHAIGCDVPVPERAQDAAADETGQVDDNNSVYNDTGSPPDRAQLLKSLASTLNVEEYTAEGKPKVEAINDLLEEGTEPFTAAERDELWED